MDGKKYEEGIIQLSKLLQLKQINFVFLNATNQPELNAFQIEMGAD